MEGALEGDDRRPAAGSPGELEGGLDRLGAGVEEHDRVDGVRQGVGDHRGEGRDGFREADCAGRTDEQVDLAMDRRSDGRMMMAEGGHGDPVGEIEVRLAGRVVQPMTLTVAPATLEVAAEHR